MIPINPVEQFVNQSTSRYSLNHQKTIIEYDGSKVYLDPYVISGITESDGDQYEQITSQTRLDIIANKYYNDSKLWWVLAMVNNISNPISDNLVGKILWIPTMSSLIKNGVTK